MFNYRSDYVTHQECIIGRYTVTSDLIITHVDTPHHKTNIKPCQHHHHHLVTVTNKFQMTTFIQAEACNFGAKAVTAPVLYIWISDK